MDLGLIHKNVFVTASTSGIGLSIAKAFMDEGAIVTINGRDQDKLNRCCRLLALTYRKQDVRGFCGDMTIKAMESINYVVGSSALGSTRNLDILVANLGSGKTQSDPLSLPEWMRMFDTNLLSAVALMESYVPRMAEGGSIVLISSIAGLERVGAHPAYAVAKAGISTLVKNIAPYMAKKGLRINAVAPGNIEFSGGRWDEIKTSEPARHAATVDKTPLKRMGTPEEIANSVLFLSSNKSSYTTGETLVVDGGFTS